VAGGVHQVEAVAAVVEGHGRGGDRDAAVLFHLHEIGPGAPGLALCPHLTRHLDRAAVEQEFLGQRGLARVGVADDGEGAPAGDFGRQGGAVVQHPGDIGQGGGGASGCARVGTESQGIEKARFRVFCLPHFNRSATVWALFLPRRRCYEAATRMDLGIRGKRALVCAAARGWDGAAPRRWRRRRRSGHQRARGRGAGGDGGGDPGGAWRRGDDGRRRHHHRGGARRGAGRGGRCRHPGHQCRRPAAGHVVRLEPRRFHARLRREHADADRADAGLRAGDDRARLGSGGQHHLAVGQGADPGAGAVEHRAHRADGVRRRHARQVAARA
jgi:hypothetical protein